MIDFHSHIVFGVDDGSRSIEESVQIIKEAKEAGFKGIIATPHYMENYYEFNYEEIEQRIHEIENRIKDFDIKVFHGNEIYSTTNIKQILTQRNATSLNNSKYVLIEFPMNEKPMNMLEVLYEIKNIGKVPVVAHPERYSYVQSDPNMLIDLIEDDILFQANYGSIIGQYGKQIQKTSKQLLQNNFIHFLGSDVHKKNTIYTNMDIIIDTLEKTIGRQKTKELSYINPGLVLQNKQIEIEEPIEIKEKSIFSKFFKK